MVDTEALSARKVAIFTTFSSADEAYSLNRVVIDQIKMLTQQALVWFWVLLL